MKRIAIAAALCLLAFVAQLNAVVITDPPNDFLATLSPLAPRAGDLDVISASVSLLGATFLFSATLNGPVNTTPEAFYVWGVNRGAGAPSPDTFNIPGIVFDSLVIVQNEGTGVVNLITSPATPLPAGSITVSGNTIQATVPVALLPSRGFEPSAYTWNLWPRWGGVPFGTAQISDFAPNDQNAPVTVVPEPATASLLLGGLFIGVLIQRKRRLGNR